MGGITGGTTTAGVDVTDAVQELVHPVFVTVRTYGVVALIGGIIIITPDAESMRLPGLSTPVRLPDIDQLSVVPLPLIILFGLIDIIQAGAGITGGTTGGTSVFPSANTQR